MKLLNLIQWLGVGLLIVAVNQGCTSAPQDVQTLLDGGQLRESTTASLQQVLDKILSAASRRTAAWRLLDETSPDRRRAIGALLASGSPEHAWRTTTQVIALHPSRPDEAWWPVLLDRYLLLTEEADRVMLAEALGRFDSRTLRQRVRKACEDTAEPIDSRVRLVRLLGYFRDRETAERLLGLTTTDPPEAVQVAAFEALIHLTGLSGLNHDRTAWLAWWGKARKLGDIAWFEHLLANTARQQVAQRLRQNAVERRLLDSQSALYRTTRPADRPAVLAYMLRDPLPPIRQLGLDLALQRLLDNQPFEEALRIPLRERLVEAQPVLRSRSALLLRDLQDKPAAKIAAERLANDEEHVTSVVRAYLLLSARLPQAPVVEPALGLLEDPQLRGEAAGALASAVDAQMLDQKQRQRAARLARRGLPDDGPASASIVTLLGKVGLDKDFAKIALWIDSDRKPIKQAAALAWAESNRSLRLLANRAGDPVIRPIAIAAAERRGVDPWTLRTLVTHRPDQPEMLEAWRRALVTMAGRVGAEHVLWSSEYLDAQGESLATLERLLTASLVAPAPVEPTQAHRIALWLMRAEVRLRAQTPAPALADLEQLEPLLDQMTKLQVDRYRRRRIDALLSVGEFDETFVEAARLLSPEASGTGSDDPVIDQLIEAARQQAAQKRTDVGRRILVKLILLLGPSIKPEVAQRITLLEAEIGPVGDAPPDAE